MVRPHTDWTDIEDGYRRNDVIIAVNPAHATTGETGGALRSGVPEANANCYSVDLLTAVDTPSESYEDLVQFEDPTAAWEFANLLTHYFAADGVDVMGRKRVFTGADPDAGDHPQGPVTNTPAVRVFTAILGYYPIPDEMADLIETAKSQGDAS